MTVLTDIHLSEGAGVSHTDDLHCKVAEEVYDLQGPRAEAEDENEGCDNGAQQLLQDEHLKREGTEVSRKQDTAQPVSPRYQPVSSRP